MFEKREEKIGLIEGRVGETPFTMRSTADSIEGDEEEEEETQRLGTNEQTDRQQTRRSRRKGKEEIVKSKACQAGTHLEDNVRNKN